MLDSVAEDSVFLRQCVAVPAASRTLPPSGRDKEALRACAARTNELCLDSASIHGTRALPGVKCEARHVPQEKAS